MNIFYFVLYKSFSFSFRISCVCVFSFDVCVFRFFYILLYYPLTNSVGFSLFVVSSNGLFSVFSFELCYKQRKATIDICDETLALERKQSGL